MESSLGRLCNGFRCLLQQRFFKLLYLLRIPGLSGPEHGLRSNIDGCSNYCTRVHIRQVAFCDASEQVDQIKEKKHKNYRVDDIYNHSNQESKSWQHAITRRHFPPMKFINVRIKSCTMPLDRETYSSLLFITVLVAIAVYLIAFLQSSVELRGQWENEKEDPVADFQREGMAWFGYLVRPNTSQDEAGFRSGEQTFRDLQEIRPGVYEGELKWRSSNGSSWWQPVTLTISHSTMHWSVSPSDVSKRVTSPIPYTPYTPPLYLIFVMDASTSMDWPTYLTENQLDLLSADTKDKMQRYQEKLILLANSLTEQEKDQFFGGCPECRLELEGGTFRKIPPLTQRLNEQNDSRYELANEVETLRADLESVAGILNISKMEVAKQAAIDLVAVQSGIASLFNISTNTAVVSFANYGYIESYFDTTHATTKETLKRLRTYGGTNTGGGLERAFTLIEYYSDAPAGSNIHIVLLTDGRSIEGWDPSVLLKTYHAEAAEFGVKIDTIGLGVIEDEIDKEFLLNLAEGTGGSYRFAATANELTTAFLRTAHTSIGQDIIFEAAATPSENEEGLTEKFAGSYYAKSILISFNWHGGPLGLQLKDKEGNNIPEDRYQIIKNENSILIKMDNPPTGEMQLLAYRTDESEQPIEYNVIVSEKKGEFRFNDWLNGHLLPIIGAITTIIAIVFFLTKGKKPLMRN